MQKGQRLRSGSEALQVLREAAAAGHPFDLVLLDMQMPGMDGLTLAQAIKADPAIAETRLDHAHLHCAADASPEELKRLGIDVYLVKPVKQARSI